MTIRKRMTKMNVEVVMVSRSFWPSNHKVMCIYANVHIYIQVNRNDLYIYVCMHRVCSSIYPHPII